MSIRCIGGGGRGEALFLSRVYVFGGGNVVDECRWRNRLLEPFDLTNVYADYVLE